MPTRGSRLTPVNRIATRLQQRVQDKLAERHQSVQQAADEMDVPYWIIRDTLRGATDCPRPLYLPNMARWLGVSTDELIRDAYAALDTPASMTPPSMKEPALAS